MGPGYFPSLLGVLLGLLAILLIGRSFVGDPEPMAGFSLAPLFLVLVGSLLFGLLIRPAGLLIATMVTVVIGSIANRGGRPLEVALLALFLAVGSVLIFVYGLEQPIPIFGYWFG
jgi:putative tricarboxylic transport membrane protein